MNERIKELVEQATTTFDFGAPINFFDKEKFAELIVEECAEVAGCNGHISGFSLGDLIKEHLTHKGLYDTYRASNYKT